MWNGINDSDATVKPPVAGPFPPLTMDSMFGSGNQSVCNSNFLDTFKFDNIFAQDNSAVLSSLARDEMERARLPPVNYFNPTINYNFYPQAPTMDTEGSTFGSSFINTSITATLPSFESYLGDRPPMSAYLSDLNLDAGSGSGPRPGSGSNLFSAIPYPGSTIGITDPDPSRSSSPIASSVSESDSGSIAWEDPGVDLYDGSGTMNAGSSPVINPGCGMAAGSQSIHFDASLLTTMTFNSIGDYIPFAVAGAEPAKKRNARKNPAALDVQHLQRNALKPVKLRAPKKGKKKMTNDDWFRQFLVHTTTSFENAVSQEKMLELKKDAEMRVEHFGAAQKKKRGGKANSNRKSAATLRNKLKKQFGLTPPTASSVKNDQSKTVILSPTRINAYASSGFSLLRPNCYVPLHTLKKFTDLASIPFVVEHLLKREIELPMIPFIPEKMLRRSEELPWAVLLILPRLRTAVHKRKTTVPKKVDAALEKEEMDGEIKIDSNVDHEMPLLSPGMVEETLEGIDNDSIIDVEALSSIYSSSSSSSSSYDDSADDYKPPAVKRRRRCHKKREKIEKDLNNNKKAMTAVEKTKKIQGPNKKTPKTDKTIKKELIAHRTWDLVKVTNENKDYWLEPCEANEECVIKTNANWWYALGEHRIDAIGLEIIFDANF